ncbi:MAG: TraR/DksA family transcriptional regulator [Nitrospinota bacterium]|nr:TraR/DksA family transcriptional regulator [Nitrospinota bacterium]
MEKEKLEMYRGMLLEYRKRLTGDFEKALDSANEEFGMEVPDMNDEATRTMSRRLLMSIGDKSLDTLRQIEEALERIDDGEYGVCAECEALIPEGRLELVPFAIFCVRCQEQLEKE